MRAVASRSARIWNAYVDIFGGNIRLAIVLTIPIIVSVIGLVVRGFQVESWAWTEHYGDAYYYFAYAK